MTIVFPCAYPRHIAPIRMRDVQAVELIEQLIRAQISAKPARTIGGAGVLSVLANPGDHSEAVVNLHSIFAVEIGLPGRVLPTSTFRGRK